ncbi:MAG TPA: hypothetical protein VHZ55_27860 [Bryobacteraceae bacterium]|nr:hypothetical protein [Bryobacteraceae bacterium]
MTLALFFLGLAIIVVPFVLFWGSIVAIIGPGVRLGTAGRSR